MYFLIYNSTVADGVGEVDLHDILTTSVERNEKLDVTGLLVYPSKQLHSTIGRGQGKCAADLRFH